MRRKKLMLDMIPPKRTPSKCEFLDSCKKKPTFSIVTYVNAKVERFYCDNHASLVIQTFFLHSIRCKIEKMEDKS